MNKLKISVTSAFGIEGLLRRELNKLGYEKDLEVGKGGVTLYGDFKDVARLNLWTRLGERVVIEVGSFKAKTFEELFTGTKQIPWEQWILKDGAFPVNGKSIKSALFSLSDCQKIIKKAIVERLKEKFPDTEWFSETGAEYRINFRITNDIVVLTIDTSGDGLHKRGYRNLGYEAPLKETLACAMLTLANWHPDIMLFDPFCGTGTILIEAAMKAMNIAPGLDRNFICEKWPQMDKKIFQELRKEAWDVQIDCPDLHLEGYDISEKAISMARHHAKRAGLEDKIHFQVRDVKDFKNSHKYGAIITNPPYGERMGDQIEAKNLYKLMGSVFGSLDTWSIYVITSFKEFEQAYGKTASKNTKLFNGFLECRFYQYHGPRPPRPRKTEVTDQSAKDTIPKDVTF